MVFLKEFLEKVDFEENQQTTKKHEKFPRGQIVKDIENLAIILVPLIMALSRGHTGQIKS